MPSVDIVEVAPNLSHLTITVTKEELEPIVQKELKKYRNKANIRGFRAGQAPASLVKSMFGKQIFSEQIGNLVTKSYQESLENFQQHIIGDPQPISVDQDHSLNVDKIDDVYEFKFEIGYFPKVQLPDFTLLDPVEKYVVSDIELMVDKNFEEYLRSRGEQTSVFENIEENDAIIINAREIDGNHTTEFQVLVKDIADETLKQQILTLKGGDTFIFDIHKIESFSNERLFRKYILNIEDEDKVVGEQFEGTIQEVKRILPVTPDENFLTESFGASVTTVEAAKALIREQYITSIENTSKNKVFRAVKEQIESRISIDLPEEYLKKWLRNSHSESTKSIQEEDFQAVFSHLRWQKTLQEIALLNGVEVTEKEVREVFKARFRNYMNAGSSNPQIESMLDSIVDNLIKSKNEEVRQVEEEIFTKKTYYSFYDQIPKIEKVITYDELVTLNRNEEKAIEEEVFED